VLSAYQAVLLAYWAVKGRLIFDKKNITTMRSKILLVCMILGLSAAVNTSHAADAAPKAYSDVISTYIEGYMTGNYKKMDLVLSDDASIKIPRAETLLIHSRASLLEQMKKTGSNNQNCESKMEVLDKSEAMIVAKVDFKYNEFTQHNYLVLEKNEQKEWKITQVCKFFEDNKSSHQEPTNVTASK
jgi:hypothetical protein